MPYSPPATARDSKAHQDGSPVPPSTTITPLEVSEQDMPTSVQLPPMHVPAGTTNLTQDSYLERLQSVQHLSPDLARQLGFVPAPPTADTNDQMAQAPATDGRLERVKDLKKSKKNERVVCHRCHSLAHHGTPLPPTAGSIPSEGFFPAPSAPPPLFLQKIHQTATNNVAVVVVSLLDFPHSLPQPVIDTLLLPRDVEKTVETLAKGVGKDGKQARRQRTVLRTPVVIVANKFDLLPEGANKDRVMNYLWDWFKARDLHRNIQRIHVVSARHPSEGDIRIFLKSLGDLWHDSDKGHITLIGAENVGKSALLNAMIFEGAPASGRAAGLSIQNIKERLDGEAMQKKHKAQLQHLMLTAGKILSPEEREEKLELEQAIQHWEERKRAIGSSSSLGSHTSSLSSKTKAAKYETTVSNIPGTTLEKITIPLALLSRHLKSDYKPLQRKYLIDTPGIRIVDDFTTKLTLDELKVSLPKRVLTPTSFMVEEGKSFFLGGLIRIDCLPGDMAVSADTSTEHRATKRPPALKLTFFTTLPFHKTSLAQADQLLKKSAAGQLTILQPPFGTPERLSLFPPLAPIHQGLIRVDLPIKHVVGGDSFDRLDGQQKERRVKDKRGRRIMPFDKFEGICDVVFAGGLGWMMVSALPTAEVVPPIKLRVWTPEGKGLAIRPECLLPNLADDHVNRTAGGIRQKVKLFQPLPARDDDSITYPVVDQDYASKAE
ncbi:nitric oxide associated protein 1 [Actinomortierella ambigua]|uniref:Nitric oxide associated protein 1 n=1 Tax=Actinomortierella ambigua TaxID=1343610 RepID=A0A9P6Q1N8_9FUNG|nr:nitric oxide associated protein 1 [Actinomortierella ambigua]